MKPLSLLISGSLLLLATEVSAHDFWIERQGEQFIIQYGHHGGEVLPLAADKIKSVRCRDTKNKSSEHRSRAKFLAKAAQVQAPCLAISSTQDHGYFCLTPDGEKNLPKNKCPQAVKSWQSRQFAKWIDPQAGALAQTPLGDELEIVPLTDLRQVKTGNKASFRVLHAGRPLAGAVVAINHQPLGETDSQGQVRIKIRSQDLESLSATMRKKISTPEADEQIFEASLSFPVAR